MAEEHWRAGGTCGVSLVYLELRYKDYVPGELIIGTRRSRPPARNMWDAGGGWVYMWTPAEIATAS